LLAGIAALVGVTAFASACGQKGPLYLPEEDEKEDEKDKKEKTSRRKFRPPLA
jgi:predicted small lipoprotein YifL